VTTGGLDPTTLGLEAERTLHCTTDTCCFLIGLAWYVTLNIHIAVRTCISTRTCVCECMIAAPQNMDNLGSHMYDVLYFEVLIRSSF
jgi:hypothetical protein